MKLLNLRKLRNSALAVLFAVAVMFVMPAAVFAYDTDVIDIEDNTINIAEPNAELPTATEEFVDFTEAAEPEITDSLIPNDICYGICCDVCDEDCDGTCCDMCIILDSMDNTNVPDNSEYEFGDEFTVGTDVPDNIGSEIVTGSEEEGNFGNPYEITVDPANGFTDFNENENTTPVVPYEPIFPDDYYNDVIIPENPEDIYQPEGGNEPADNDLIGIVDENYDNENEEEIIYGDDLTDEEEEIIFDDDNLTDDENSEIPDDSNSENSDEVSGEDDSDEENADNIIDEEDNENSDNAADEDDTDTSDDENSDTIIDEESSDNSDDDADEDDLDNSDTTDEEEDTSDSEALEEDDNPIINVVLPTSISVVVNPYNLKTVNDNDFHYSILSPEYSIKNYSNCDVSIVATVSASTEGGVVISPYDLNGSETKLTAFVYLEATHESEAYSDNYNNNANQLAFSNEAVSKEILTLADGSDGETTGYFKIKGQAVLPEGADYSSEAMLNMVITFNIAPVSNSVAFDNAVAEDENADNAEYVENVENIDNTETENVENVNDNIESANNVEDFEPVV